MNSIIGFLKTSYKCNKKIFFLAVAIMALVVIVGCSTGNGPTGNAGAPPPNGPIGGGCGG
jgi:hypothetical protein